MPEFHAEEEERLERKREELEPHVEDAMARRDDPRTIPDEESHGSSPTTGTAATLQTDLADPLYAGHFHFHSGRGSPLYHPVT